MVMLGVFASITPEIDPGTWERMIGAAFRTDLQPVNLAAFRLGLGWETRP
jgi:Pyruvate/2-oxoacid:ferredoxin oxidoreductase gamma subunit